MGVFWVLPILLVVFVFARLRLKTKIMADGIGIAYPPIFKKVERSFFLEYNESEL